MVSGWATDSLVVSGWATDSLVVSGWATDKSVRGRLIFFLEILFQVHY